MEWRAGESSVKHKSLLNFILFISSCHRERKKRSVILISMLSEIWAAASTKALKLAPTGIILSVSYSSVTAKMLSLAMCPNLAPSLATINAYIVAWSPTWQKLPSSYGGSVRYVCFLSLLVCFLVMALEDISYFPSHMCLAYYDDLSSILSRWVLHSGCVWDTKEVLNNFLCPCFLIKLSCCRTTEGCVPRVVRASEYLRKTGFISQQCGLAHRTAWV